MSLCESCGNPVDRPFCNNCGAPTGIAARSVEPVDPPESATPSHSAPSSDTLPRPARGSVAPPDPAPSSAEPPPGDRPTRTRALIVINSVLAVIMIFLFVVVLVDGLDNDEDDTHTPGTPAPTSSIMGSTEPTDATDAVTPPDTGPASSDAVAEEETTGHDRDEIARAMESVGDLSVGPVNIVLPVDVSPPAMPTVLDGWRQSGPLESTEVRVFEGVPFSYSSHIGSMGNRCGAAIWTARWRILNPTVLVRAGVEFEEVVRNDSDFDVTFDPSAGGAGFMSASICETPVFTWESTSGESNLADVLIEVQYWEPAV